MPLLLQHAAGLVKREGEQGRRESCLYHCLTFARPAEAGQRRRGRVQKGKEITFSAGLRAFGTGN